MNWMMIQPVNSNGAWYYLINGHYMPAQQVLQQLQMQQQQQQSIAAITNGATPLSALPLNSNGLGVGVNLGINNAMLGQQSQGGSPFAGCV